MRKSLLSLSILTLFYYCSTPEEGLTNNSTSTTKTYNLTVEASDGGTVSSSGGNITAGSSVSIAATPNSGYTFTNWSNGSTDNPISITVNSNLTLTANFTKRSYPLSINIIGEGTVTEEIINTGKTTDYEHGTTVRLTAVPNEGWGVTKWEGAIESKSATIDVVVNEDKELTIEFHERYVPVYRGLTYDYPNNTTSKAIEQSFKQPKNIKDSIVLKGLLGTTFADSTIVGSEKYMHWSPGIEFDYNNDGNVDYFSFLTANYPLGNWAVEDGLYMLIDDVFNPSRDYKYYSTNGHKFEIITELIDVNNDGIYEIIAGNQNSHNTGNGSFPDQIPPRIHSFYSNGNMNFVDFINEPRGTHDFSTGDVDNDGDTDVLYWEYTLVNGTNITEELWNTEYYSKPILYLNNGNGDFIEQDRNLSFPGLYANYIQKELSISDQFVGLYTDLFDFDDDGNLDLIVGNNYGDYDQQTEGIKIFWGNGEGQFDFNNGYSLPNQSIINSSVPLFIPFGGSYLDFDNDGDLDIIITGETDYAVKGWWIQIFEQKDNRVFEDVTSQRLINVDPIRLFQPTNGDNVDPIFMEKNWVSPTKDPFAIDIDNDGDFDILPIGPQVHLTYGYSDNFYYENVDGLFYERWYNDQEE